MKLLVSCIPYDKGKSGISTYVREVVRELAAQGHELTLLVEPDADLGGPRSVAADAGGPRSVAAADGTKPVPPAGATLPASHAGGPRSVAAATIRAPRWTRKAALSMLWHLFALPFWIRRRRREFDGFVICAANRRVCAFYPVPTAATVHDLANFHIPGKYSRMRMFYLARVLPFFAKRAQHLVAVSGATKADMLKYWHCRDEDVTVLYNGLSGGDRLQSTAIDRNRGRTILYISRIEHPGKNHVRLIEAYGRLPRTLAEAHPLVIAGADWKDAEIVHGAAAKSPYADLIRFTGFVPSDEIGKLWADAGFYIFPSLFEGFGLSLIEAMARGVPCACSNNGSLGEIAGDVAITFNPESVDEIAAALERMLAEGEDGRAARIARGREWIRRFSWADHAAGIAKLIGAMAGRHALDAPCRVSRLFGIPIAKVSEPEAVEQIISIARKRRSRDGGRAAFIATLNVDFVSNAVSGWPFGGNDELWGYLRNADFVTADGMPIVLLSKLKRDPLPARVTGADMVPAICRRCAEEGLSVYVLGGDKDAIEAAFAKLGLPRNTAQGGPRSVAAADGTKPVPPAGVPPAGVPLPASPLRVVGIDPAFVKLDEDQPEIVERINAAKPDVLFVALGNPKQELWMGRNAAKLDAGAMIGIGGTFNFLAGRVKRAPKWMQRCGLEWIYRIMQEPGRLWRRYAYGLVKYAWLSLMQLCGRCNG